MEGIIPCEEITSLGVFVLSGAARFWSLCGAVEGQLVKADETCDEHSASASFGRQRCPHSAHRGGYMILIRVADQPDRRAAADTCGNDQDTHQQF